ncbi:nuclear protein MDM1 isoform X2 [Sorex fumeus]|uniref:nuclear protein MDM1 isoform X2 n=1 Tax=Sorex fumeus TaxID=62283 RepID=UPI0024AD465C|nr:nuclear protein MDM1 isoform X2 [Sorex fumeus]
MPVRFKGLSEYQRNFLWKKSYLSECYNPSVAQRHPWAGLRSDQFGITREPGFLSKRKVPYHDPQISKSFEWHGPVTQSDVVLSPKPRAPETAKLQETNQEDGGNEEKVPVLEACRVPKRTRSHSADSRTEGASDIVENNEDELVDHAPVTENVQSEQTTGLLSENVDDGVDRVLRKKAGLTVVPSKSALRNSEYQRQFVWKTPKEITPGFTANQVFHSKSQLLSQFKDNPVIHETEYKRNFKGLSPVKEPKLRNSLKENGNFETISSEKKCNKIDDLLKLEAEMESKDLDQPKLKVSPWRHQRLGKVNSEYRAKFLSPSQYFYKAGAWTHVKENIPDQGSLNAMWYAEVKELREKAEFYRKRVQGTHFSRDHLNQILSDKNRCWDVSSITSSEGTISTNIRALDLAGDPTSHTTLQKGSSTRPEEKRPPLEEQPQTEAMDKECVSEAPTVPVRRRLAWDAEDPGEDMQKQPREEEQEEQREKDKQAHTDEPEKWEVLEKYKADKMKEGSESSSLSSEKGGRLPTPMLKELDGMQRTHHDRTTPAVGGAVLVSPSKERHRVPEQRKRLPSQSTIDMPKNFTKKEIRSVTLLTSPAAGMKTIDPLPLREDSEINIPKLVEPSPPVSKISEYPADIPRKTLSPCATSFWNPALRIQGSLKDPEFQHNVGKARRKSFQLPQQETFNDEDEDRLSVISARSAASSLQAFQTLARAQKRKENFWVC